MEDNNNYITAGTIDLLLNNENEYTTEWIPFEYNNQWDILESDKHKLKLIKRYQYENKLSTTCFKWQSKKFLRVRIYLPIHNDSTSFLKTVTYTTTTISSMLDLLEYVDRNEDAFTGEYTEYISKPKLSLFPNQVQKSLLDIFIHMPSPKVMELKKDVIAEEVLNEIISKPCPTGMKTELYDYQKKSLWKIVQRELAPQSILPPTFVKLISVDNTEYFIDQLSSNCTTIEPLHKDVPGGIICEDMGSGKTCICLSVIMATKNIIKDIDGVKIKTDFSDKLKISFTNRFKSLVDIATEETLIHRVNWKSYKQHLPSTTLSNLEKYPLYYEHKKPLFKFIRLRRGAPPSEKVTNIYFSNTTLVIVPDNLIAQWTSEIYKHIIDDQIDFIVLDNIKQNVPDPNILVHYDLVLISQTRFAYEEADGGFGFEFGGIPKDCGCTQFEEDLLRAPFCTLLHPKPRRISPLLYIHWKRVIIDEGHRLSSLNSSNFATLTKKLFYCWIWIVSGTPTTNLTEVIDARSHEEVFIDDLRRLGVLYSEVLKLFPFQDSHWRWNQHITRPFSKNKSWAIDNLNSLMCTTMIRNRKEDIENDVLLPPLNIKTVFLDFDYYQWIAHNCQISLISLNAILSKREGPDYLFNKKNYKPLRETVSNITQSCSWHSIDISSLKSSYKNCIEKLKQVNEGKEHYEKEDELGLRKIKDLFETALNDQVFLEMMTKHEVSFVVQGLPALFRESWGWCNGDKGVYMSSIVDDNHQNPWYQHCIIPGDIVVDLINDINDVKKQDMDIYVYDSESGIIESTELYEREKRIVEKRLKRKNDITKMHIESLRSQIIRSKLKKMLNEKVPSFFMINNGISKRRKQSTMETHFSENITFDENEAHHIMEKLNDPTGMTFYTRNVFNDVRVLCSSSSKINYLVNQILTFHKNEKCIIFSQYFNEMQEIYLALKLLKIRTLMYLESSMSSVQRSQAIMTFNTSENANVMIMAVQKAAYGIDLSSATRVYFVSPVWQTAMEQQAIKRAHRIGQKKPVYVEVLVIKNSIEDALLKRRNAITEVDDDVDTDESKNVAKKEFFNDKKLQNILNHANFVPKPSHIIQLNNEKYQQKIISLDKPITVISIPSPSSTSQQQLSTNHYSSKNNGTELQPPQNSMINIIIDDNDDSISKRKKKRKVNFI
ncbi:unnamed protein product [Cunninghamella blakesleeana]